MNHLAIARGLLASLCAAQGGATLIIDLNRTHATNPHWPRHARFHLVWQAMSYALLALVEVALVLAPGPMMEQRFYLAALLAILPMLSFLAAFFFRNVYRGGLSDANGIPPVKVEWFGLRLRVDMNLAAELVAILMLLGIVALFRD